MIDDKTKDVLDLCDIKQDMVRTMLNKHTTKTFSKDEITKFLKYLNLQLKENKSKNNLDRRISSIYKIIRKQYNSYTELNQIITNSN